jgi:hypothetical protein
MADASDWRLLTRSDDYGEIRYEKETKCVEEVEVWRFGEAFGLRLGKLGGG